MNIVFVPSSLFSMNLPEMQKKMEQLGQQNQFLLRQQQQRQEGMQTLHKQNLVIKQESDENRGAMNQLHLKQEQMDGRPPKITDFFSVKGDPTRPRPKGGVGPIVHKPAPADDKTVESTFGEKATCSKWRWRVCRQGPR